MPQWPRLPAKLKPSYDPKQTWPPPILRLLTSTKWRKSTGLMLAAMFVGEHLLANRRLQTLLLLWLDVRSLENIWYKSMMTASDRTIKDSSHTRLSHLISSECSGLNWTRCRFRWDEMIWDECCCGDSLVHWPLTSTIQVQVCYETLSVMSHLATLSRNSDAQPCRWSDTDKLTRCTLFRIRVAQLGDAPCHTYEFDARVKVVR